MLGADYSDARPGGAALASAGVQGVGRYLGTDARCITAAEYQDLTAHGIAVWLVTEHQSTDLSVSMLQGAAKGVSDAQQALQQIAAQGIPDGAPVFWAADFDISPGSPRLAAAQAYVAGFNTAIPPGRRGGYGGLWFLKQMHDAGLVDFLWECASTSFRHGVDPASVPLHIQQTTGPAPVPGTDHDEILQPNYGQIGSTAPEEDDLSAADVQQILDGVRRDARYRLYYNTDTKLYFAINHNLPSTDPSKVAYFHGGADQIAHWYSPYEFLGDSAEQAVQVTTAQQATLEGMARGTDSAFTGTGAPNVTAQLTAAVTAAVKTAITSTPTTPIDPAVLAADIDAAVSKLNLNIDPAALAEALAAHLTLEAK